MDIHRGTYLPVKPGKIALRGPSFGKNSQETEKLHFLGPKKFPIEFKFGVSTISLNQETPPTGGTENG